MREIKFRAWSPVKKRMELVGDIEWDSHEGMEIESICTETQKLSPAIFILMQYTGLKDKNGKEIYEGDILQLNSGRTGVVAYHEERAGFIFQDEYNEMLYQRTGYIDEIIGNIYENPELI